MKIEKENLIKAAEKIGIPSEQAEKLWNNLNVNGNVQQPSSNKYNFSQVLYYFGAVLVLFAMAWFIGDGWERLGGQGIFWVSFVYFLVFLTLGNFLWNKKKLITPGGLFITLAVGMVPLVVYGLQKWSGFWIDSGFGPYQDFYSWINGRWFVMEIATLVVGSIAFYFYRFSFLTMPIFLTLWFMSLDVVNLIAGGKNVDIATQSKVAIVFGLAVLVIAYIMDFKSERKLAFWPYFFGAISFWSGLSDLLNGSEYSRFAYLLINLGLILLSVLLQRTIFVVCGAFGVMIYLMVIFSDYFIDSISFPIFLSLIGVAIVFLGIYYQKHYAEIESKIMNYLPQSIKKWFPR